MRVGFTITTLSDIEKAVDISQHFHLSFDNSKFYIVVVGSNPPLEEISIVSNEQTSFHFWSDFAVDSQFFHHWPFIVGIEEVVSLLIPHLLQFFLNTSDECFYFATNFSESAIHESPENLKFFIEGASGLQEKSTFASSRGIISVYAAQEDSHSVAQWASVLDTWLKTSAVTFDTSFNGLLRVINQVNSYRENASRVATPIRGGNWNTASNGLRIRPTLRRLALTELVNGEKALPSPFDPAQTEYFVNWGRSISPYSKTGLPRFLNSAVEDDEDIFRDFVLFNFESPRLSRKWWKARRTRLSPEIKMFKVRDLVERTEKLDFKDEGPITPGVDVFGYMSAGVGVGQATRLLLESLQESEIDFSAVSLPRPRSVRLQDANSSVNVCHDISLMCVDAFQFGHQQEMIGHRYFEKRYTVGQWFWELEEVPNYYQEALSRINEFWAPTVFLQKAMESVAPESVQICHMPLPISVPAQVDPLSKKTLGIGERFLFYFTFDFLSVMKRKNPQAIISAFCEAFSESDGAALLIKSINGVQRPREFKELQQLMGRRKDVHLVDDFLPPHVSSSLMATADCYVSLHRSEGYGLTLAEAMAMGKPVIATGYSGNLDFMNEDNSILIPYSLVPVGENAEGYPATSKWAEPDHKESVRAFQRVFSEQDQAMQLGAAAQRYVETNFSTAAVGSLMRQRIEEIHRLMSQ